jgi:PPOX class probable F420-dependent enzyme
MAKELPRLTGWEAALVDESKVARLGTNSARGWPHLVPVCYARSGETMYIAIDEKPKTSRNLARLRNVASDPRATVLVDRYDDAWRQLAWVRLECEATVVMGSTQPNALAALRARYQQYRAMPLEERELIVLAIRRVVSWRWER